MPTRWGDDLYKRTVVCIIIHVLKLFHLLNMLLYYLPPPPFDRSMYELTLKHLNKIIISCETSCPDLTSQDGMDSQLQSGFLARFCLGQNISGEC